MSSFHCDKTVNLSYLQVEKRIRQFQFHFTSGCFDLFHIGHVYLLNRIKEEMELYQKQQTFAPKCALVVGVNTDSSITAWKGRAPVIPHSDRMIMVSLHPAVDYVVGFNEETAEKLIRALHPAVIYHGSSSDRPAWGPDSVDELEGFEGEVVRIQIVNDWSTTAIIEKVVKEFFDVASV